MRRRPGIQGLQHREAAANAAATLGAARAAVQRSEMKEQLSRFQDALSAFAARHSDTIRSDAVFRAQFHEMCAKVGVDPLASTRGSWASKLGLGTFYAEIAVTAAEAMIVTKPINGGLMPLPDLIQYVKRRRGPHADPVSEDDCRRAIAKLATLGGSKSSSTWRSVSSPPGVYEIITIAGKHFVRSVPVELNSDQNEVLTLAEKNGGAVTVQQLRKDLHWSKGRVGWAIDQLLRDGLLLIDDGEKDGARRYWPPFLMDAADIHSDAMEKGIDGLAV